MIKTILSKVWTFLKEKPRLALELLLVTLLLLAGFFYNRLAAQRQQAEAVHAGLEKGLKAQLTLVRNQLQIVSKDANGKIIIRTVYVPPEGSITIKQKDFDKLMAEYKDLLTKLANAPEEQRKAIEEAIKKKLAEMGTPDEVIVKTWGLTFKPGAAVEFANRGLQPRMDFKWFYYSRYGLEAGGSPNGAGLTISRHIDDLVWGHPQNVEIFSGFNIIRFNNDASQIVGGLRFNF